MTFLDILGIISRVICGLCCVGFMLGFFLHEKHPTFEKIWTSTGFIALMYGLGRMWMYAIMGEMI